MRQLRRFGDLSAYLMVLPTLALAAWVIGYPLIETLSMSLHAVNRFAQIQAFQGVQNFVELFGDPIFQMVLWHTLIWTAAVVVWTIVLSMPIALILNEEFAGRDLMRLIVMLPWAVSVTMTAVVWRWSLNGQYGMVNAVLRALGVLDGPREFLASASSSFPIEIAIGIVVSIPFTVTVFLGGLSSLPQEIYEAARIDGATRMQSFRLLTLPLIRSYVNMGVVLNIIYVFNSFSIVWVLTQGDPANATDILVTYLYKLAFRYGRLAEASAVSLLMFAALLVFSISYALLAMRHDAGET